MSDTRNGTPWNLGIRCDHPGCGECFRGDFLVSEDSTRDERLRIILDYAASSLDWSVVWPGNYSGAAQAEAFCPAHTVPEATR